MSASVLSTAADLLLLLPLALWVLSPGCVGPELPLLPWAGGPADVDDGSGCALLLLLLLLLPLSLLSLSSCSWGTCC
jgi:hypothetical protein